MKLDPAIAKTIENQEVPPQHFVFALVAEFSHLAFACAVEPLRIANLISGKPLYRWSFLSEDGASATCSNGSVTLVQGDFRSLPQCDRLFVLSGIHMQNHVTPSLLAMLYYARSHGHSIGALCSGAWVLAEVGFLNGEKAAIHWEYHDSFMERFQDVNLVSNVFVTDASVITASGGTATADLMLSLIAQDHGHDLSTAVADQMVYSTVREATAEQRVSLQSRNGMRNPHLVQAVKLMQDTIEMPLSTCDIAGTIGISTRQLERLFGKFLNTSPKRYFMELRLDRARNLLIQTEASVIDVAMACGFESPGHFTRVYKAAYGVAPLHQKSRIS